jgi:tetratricopeptide (TPR) repeat protein
VNKQDHYNEGMELFAQDKLDAAVAAYLRALEEDPNYADALHALAMTYAHQEKFDEAIEAGKRLIEVAPDDELAYTSLSIF